MSHSAGEMGQGERTLTRAAGLVAEAKQDFDRLSGQLEGQIQGLQGRWTGAGGTAFFQLHQAWTEKQRTIVNALDDFAGSLTSTEQDNLAADDEVGASYRQLQGRLG